jgi:hypothetical protein
MSPSNRAVEVAEGGVDQTATGESGECAPVQMISTTTTASSQSPLAAEANSTGFLDLKGYACEQVRAYLRRRWSVMIGKGPSETAK